MGPGVIKITATIKTLILEILTGEGPGHIKEINLRVSEFRPDVPQHTVRSRLSEMARSENLEERLNPFGKGFYGLYEESPNLCSVVSYPNRGPWGNAGYRGNCSGHLIKELILRFKCQSVFDPAEGSGTVRDVVAGINTYLRQSIIYEGRDIKAGWDILTGPMPEKQYDLVWFHPPYWDIIPYSAHSNDLSNCPTLEDFELKLNQSVEKLFQSVKPKGILAVLIGDKCKEGMYYALFRSLLMKENIGQLRSILIKVQYNCQSDRKIYSTNNPFFIPIKHEYCLIFQK